MSDREQFWLSHLAAIEAEGITTKAYAERAGFEPYLWLRNVLRALPAASAVEHFDALLPWNQEQAIVPTP